MYALRAAGTHCIAVAISQSGETIEILVVTRAAREHGIHLIALTNNEDSRVGRLCDQVILLQAGHEDGAGTKTVVAQCVVIYQFALYLTVALRPDRTGAATMALTELRAVPRPSERCSPSQSRRV